MKSLLIMILVVSSLYAERITYDLVRDGETVGSFVISTEYLENYHRTYKSHLKFVGTDKNSN